MVTLPSIAIMGIFLAAGFAPAQDAPNQQANSQKNAPIYGIDLRNDPSWMDDSSGNSVFDQIWSALQPGGYNMLRIPLDIRDAISATSRAVRLCSWAQNNNVKLIFVLTGADPGQALPQDYPKLVSEFVKNLITQLQSAGGQSQSSYAQIIAFQIDDELNHPGKHAGKPVAATKILEAAKFLRKMQAEALDGTGLHPIPVVASASFDFPLIQAGAISKVRLTDTAYEKAYKNLKQFLAGLAASPDIDFLAVDWFAGSISAGTADQFQPLVEKLTADIPGKPILFTTGFSSAFHTPELQQAFATNYAVLAKYCANRAGDCRFAGTILHEALNGIGAVLDPQSPAASSQAPTWDWPVKAGELAAMWTKGTKSDELTQWLATVENSMGLITLQAASSQATTPVPDTAGGSSTSGVSSNQAPSGSPGTPPSNPPACPPQPDPAQGAGTQQAAPGNCQPSPSGVKAIMTSFLGKFMNQLGDQAVPVLLGSRPSNTTGTQTYASDPFSKSDLPPNSSQPSALPAGFQAGNTFVAPGDTSVPNPGNGQPAKSDSIQRATQSAGAPQSQALTSQQQPNSTGAGTANAPGQAQISQAQGQPPSGGASEASGSPDQRNDRLTGQTIKRSGPPPTGTVAENGVPSQVNSAQAPGAPIMPVPPRTVIIVTNLPVTSSPTPKPTPTPGLVAGVSPPPKGHPPVNPLSVAIEVKLPAPVSVAQLRAGQTVTFTATVKNLGSQPSRKAATFLLSGPGKQVPPQTITFWVRPTETLPVPWTTKLPASGNMTLTVTVIDVGTVDDVRRHNLSNNSATLHFLVR